MGKNYYRLNVPGYTGYTNKRQAINLAKELQRQYDPETNEVTVTRTEVSGQYRSDTMIYPRVSNTYSYTI